MCSFLSIIRLGWMFTTVHPMDLAEEMARLMFYDFWNTFNGYDLLIATSGMVPGTATLMILLC